MEIKTVVYPLGGRVSRRRSRPVFAAGYFLVTAAFAGKPVQPPPPISVTSFVHDQDASGNSLLFQGDDVNHTSGATYTNTGNVTTGVGNPGGWGLNLYNQVARYA